MVGRQMECPVASIVISSPAAQITRADLSKYQIWSSRGRYEILSRDHHGKYFIWKINYMNMTGIRMHGCVLRVISQQTESLERVGDGFGNTDQGQLWATEDREGSLALSGPAGSQGIIQHVLVCPKMLERSHTLRQSHWQAFNLCDQKHRQSLQAMETLRVYLVCPSCPSTQTPYSQHHHPHPPLSPCRCYSSPSVKLPARDAGGRVEKAEIAPGCHVPLGESHSCLRFSVHCLLS